MELSFLNSSGGLIYHARAMRHRNTIWLPFVMEISPWLKSWEVTFEELLLIGPSGAYCLPTEWLANYKSRLGIEPDPLARKIYQLRSSPITWVDDPWLGFPETSKDLFSVEPIKKLLAKYPRADLLFCNLFGQLPLLHKNKIHNREEEYQNWQQEVVSLLSKRTFASFHDVYSADCDFDIDSRRGLPVNLRKPHTPVTDHLTSHMFAGMSQLGEMSRTYVKWQLAPKKFHLIECAKS